ncbi:MAG TPA: hypothetical protein VE174_02165 [Actinomycetota bacterium]|nr:hypothetical protein [Actinomycetota bacterium]
MESNGLRRFAGMALSVARQFDRLLAGPSIEKARRAVIDAERRQTLRRVLDDLDLGAVAAVPKLEIKEEFTDEFGGVQVSVTSPI